jgi:hypothetical protein
MGFFAVYDRVVPATNKYMATLFNTSTTRKVAIVRIYRLNWQQTAVVGVLLDQEIRFITARTAGTNVTIQQDDTLVSLSAGITADHASTVVTEGTGARSLIRRIYSTNEEAALATSQGLGAAGFTSDSALIYMRRPGGAGLVLRENQGVTIKNITNSSLGSCSYVIEFEEEPA